MKKRIFLLYLLVCMLLCPPMAQANDGCFLMNVDALDMTRLNQNDYVQQYLAAPAQGLRVSKQIPDGDAQPVRLSLVEMNGQTLVFDKDYGYQSGPFDSGPIYLPSVGNGMTDFVRGKVVDVCASNRYLIGQADIYYHDGRISVTLSLSPSANVELHSLSIHVNTDCASLASAADGPAYSQGEWIPVGEASSALLYMPMSLSYDPSGLSGYGYDLSHGYLQQQLKLWKQNCTGL